MLRRPLRLGLCLLLLFASTACSTLTTSVQPTAAPALLVAPTQRAVGPPPTLVAEDVTLPGRLLFAKDGDLWLWQGTHGQALTQQGNLTQPAWSPDGTRIVCVQRGESYSDVVLLSATGGDLLRLTNDAPSSPPHSAERVAESTWAFYPTFAPDGSEVTFSAQAAPPAGAPAVEMNLALFSIAPTLGSSKTPLYASEIGNIGRAVYTHDGNAIIFAHAPTDQSAPQLWRYDRATNVAAPLSGVPAQSYDPALSADGRWLAFAARAADRTDILAVPANGGASLRLTSIGTARAPAFSPDGKYLAFLAIAPGGHLFDLWILDTTSEADGLRAAQPRQLTHNLGIDADAGLAWGP